MSRYVLPDLLYDYSALEPHVWGHVMELHHDKHHRAYVEGANRAIEQLMEARHAGDFQRIASLEHAMAFHVSGHVLHSIFWKNLAPDGGGRPDGALGQAIDRDFGSFDALEKQLVAGAVHTMGSGWVALVWDPVIRRLGTSIIHDHQSQITQGSVPLLVMDAWEHAYYLQYQTDKERFFKALFQLWNWDDITTRFARATQVDLALENVADEQPAAMH